MARIPREGNLELKILSLIIPAYNSEAYLDKCISSMLLPEILDRLEIIVVNDGSTDATARIAEGYVQTYPETVRLISQENKGHGGALNTGCAAARGKYLKIIDADDWVETASLPEFLALLAQCDSDVVLTHYRTVDAGSGEVRQWQSSPEEFGKAYTFEEIMEHWRNFFHCLTFHGIAYRTAFYQARNFSLPEHVFYEDHEYAAYPCCHAESITPFDLFLYAYRIGDVNQSVSNANQLKRIHHIQTVIRHMTAAYKTLPASAGKNYAARKIQGVLLSYLTTALLVNPDKKAGRKLAAEQMEQSRLDTPEIYAAAHRKYRVLCMLNRLHVSKQAWQRFMDSKFYSLVRKAMHG